MPKFYITTPIYYVNARPHIGHAYSTIVADVLARRHRLLGDDTFFLTGTDEHGQKVERSAAAAGIPPQQFADEVSASFRALWQRMGITNDDYIRTTEPRHKQGVQKLWTLLEERGAIYLSTYTGQYCVSEEMFVEGPPGTIGPDGKPTETVTEENYFFRLSDYQLPLLNLIESDTLLVQPEARKNEVLSFIRGDFKELAKEYVQEEPVGPPNEEEVDLTFRGPSDWESSFFAWAFSSERIGRSKKGIPYVIGALRDLSVSRTGFTWGIPVPGNEKHVIYVWLDALANYMTAVGYGSDDPDEKEKFNRYWPASLHLVGKEIIRFHCVYWPAFLLALNSKLQHAPDEPTPVLSLEEHKKWAENWLPKAVTAHGWLLFDEAKMSKSKGNIVRSETILDAFGEHVYKKQFPDSTKEEQDLFAADVLRYFLLREIPFGQDGNFSFDALITRYNADLANGYGNLVSRTLTMIAKSSDLTVQRGNTVEGQLPIHAAQYFFAPQSGPARMLSGARLAITEGTLEEGISRHFEHTAFNNLIENVTWAIAGTDSYLTSCAPWKIVDGLERDEVLYTAAESIRIITALLYPILPYATAKVWQQLGLGDIELAAKNGELTNLQWGGLKPGTKLGPLSPIFPRADKGLAQIMIDMEAAKAAPAPSPLLDEKTAAAPEPQDTNHPGAGPRTASLPEQNAAPTVGGSSALITERTHTPHTEAAPSGIFAADKTDTATPQIAIDDFMKVDLRVAQVVVAERIPKADKLLRLEVDLGPDFPRRQILSGIAEWYTPEELVGRRIVIVSNLAPRKMRGLESHGMLLAASSGDNTKPILATFGEEIALGSRVR